MNSAVQKSGDIFRPQKVFWAMLLGSIALLGISGCGSESTRRPIFGTVSVDGVPVAQGSISFLPDRGQSGPAASTSISGGNYRFSSVNGPYAGRHRVVVGVEVDPRGMTHTDASLPANSSTAKRGPANTSTDRQPGKELNSPKLSRTQWESTTDVPDALAEVADDAINFVFQNESSSGGTR